MISFCEPIFDSKSVYDLDEIETCVLTFSFTCLKLVLFSNL